MAPFRIGIDFLYYTVSYLTVLLLTAPRVVHVVEPHTHVRSLSTDPEAGEEDTVSHRSVAPWRWPLTLNAESVWSEQPRSALVTLGPVWLLIA